MTRVHVDGLGWHDLPDPRSWHLTPGPWLFVESDPGTCQPGPWTRLDIQPNAITDGAPLWSCPGGLVPQMEGSQGAACLEWCKAHPPTSSSSIAPVTTLGIDPAPFQAIGVDTVMVECYLQGQPNALDKLGEAGREGWKDAIAVVGLDFTGPNGTYSFDAYEAFLEPLGRRWAAYATDPMQPATWDRMRAYVAAQPV